LEEMIADWLIAGGLLLLVSPAPRRDCNGDYTKCTLSAQTFGPLPCGYPPGPSLSVWPSFARCARRRTDTEPRDVYRVQAIDSDQRGMRLSNVPNTRRQGYRRARVVSHGQSRYEGGEDRSRGPRIGYSGRPVQEGSRTVQSAPWGGSGRFPEVDYLKTETPAYGHAYTLKRGIRTGDVTGVIIGLLGRFIPVA